VAFAGAPPAQLGWHGLIMAGLALVACRVRERLNLDSLRARLLLVLGGLLTHNVIVLLISQADGFLINVFTYALAGAVYTTLLAWFFFLVKERIITVEKIRTIF
jgi:cell shape-determining protein MreD